MQTRPKIRFTIGQMMALVLGIALTLAVILTPGFGPMLAGFIFLTALTLIGCTLGARRVLELVYGHRCPGCGVRGLERRAVLSFGERFFLCPSCGLRCRRSLMGGYGQFFWKDASSPEYDALYLKPTAEDPWNAPPGLEDDDVLYSKTHLNLVQNKRRRTPENPNGPGVE